MEEGEDVRRLLRILWEKQNEEQYRSLNKYIGSTTTMDTTIVFASMIYHITIFTISTIYHGLVT